VLEDSKDASLRASRLQESGAIIAEVLVNPSVASDIFHRRRAEPVILIVEPVPLCRALEDLRATVRARIADVLLKEGVPSGPNECGGLAGSQLRLDLLNRNSGVVDPRRRFGVQDGVHQRIRRPLLEKPLLLFHYELLVRRCELLHVLVGEDCDCEGGHFLQIARRKRRLLWDTVT